MSTTRKNPRSRTNGRTRLNNNRTQAARPVDVDHEMLRPLALELRRDGLTYRGIADALNHRFKLDAPVNVRGEISGTIEHHHSGSVAHVHTWNLKLLSDVELEQLEALAIRANGNAANADENVLALPAGDPVVVVSPPTTGESSH